MKRIITIRILQTLANLFCEGRPAPYLNVPRLDPEGITSRADSGYFLALLRAVALRQKH